jgi:SAM-dependent methyltransferase
MVAKQKRGGVRMSLKHTALGQVNRLFRLVNAEVTNRAELEAFRRRYSGLAVHSDRTARAAHEVEGYLTSDNPRLRSLKERYRRMTSPMGDHSKWVPDFVEGDIDLREFRGDNQYVPQYRDRNADSDYFLTAYYLKSIDRLSLFDRLNEDELFGVCALSLDDGRLVSRDLLDSIVEIYFLEDTLDLSRRRELSILDIGAGYGRLAYRLTTAFPDTVRVLCVDGVPESTFLSEFYLRYRGVDDRARTVACDEIEQALASQRIDLVTNIHAFSTCTHTAVCGWLDLVRKHEIPYIMIAPNAGDHGGTRLITREKNYQAIDYAPELQARGYELVRRRPKFLASSVQRCGISPTFHYLFQLQS